MKILVVDDEPMLRRLLQTQLNRSGHEVVEAENGQAAWDILQREHIRLVITDWMMPHMSGPELISRIRTAGFPGYTYIILVTVLDAKENVVTGLEAGADDYLTKPFEPAEMRARVAIGERILQLEARLSESVARNEKLATHDALTGLYNRRAFDAHLLEEIRRTHRYNRPLSLIMADIDHFKHYNDTHGHPQGDKLLQELARIMATSVRSTDIVARYGGEEFAIILPETPKTSALTVAEKIRVAVSNHEFPMAASQPTGKITISLGVASYPEDLPEGDVLLQRADQALYRAKTTGRNRVMTASLGKKNS